MLQPRTSFIAPSQPSTAPRTYTQQRFPTEVPPDYPPTQSSVLPGTPNVYTPAAPPPLVVPAPMGTSTGTIQPLARRAFAGCGTPIRHYSWLLSGEQGKAEAIFQTALYLLTHRQQNILGLKVESKQLTDNGIHADQDEKRLYIVLKRGIATIFLYIAPVGPNLYISRTSSVLPLISFLRAAILIIGALLSFVDIVGAVISASSPSVLTLLILPLLSVGSIFSFLFFWLPVGIFIIPSIVNAIKEGDFWIYLRRNTLTSFQLDDEVVLRHIVDYVLGAAVEHVGISRDLVAPPKDSYEGKLKVRAI